MSHRSNPNHPGAMRIYRALGGARLDAIGAKNWRGGPDWFAFEHTPANGTTSVRITQFGHELGHDTYRIDFYGSAPNSSRGVMGRGVYVKASVNGLYLDQLATAFVKQTGLSLWT